MNLSAKRVVVVGLGASGLAAAKLAASRGARVALNDSRAADALPASVHDAARAMHAELRVGSHDEAHFRDADLVVVSPGVPPLPALDATAARGVEVIGEIDFASRFVKAKIVGITGTNGKSTVTTLVGEMAATLGRPSFMGGNLGAPLASVVDTDAGAEQGVCVVELSSFQLERVPSLRCEIAALLNITNDHLDRYDSFAAYAAAKRPRDRPRWRRALSLARAREPS